MTRVRFETDRGATVEVEATPGSRLLDVAQAAGQPLEGTCNGDMACATCHVVIDAADFAHLPAASGAEEDLLDLAPAATRTSRLACQVSVPADLEALTVRIPG